MLKEGLQFNNKAQESLIFDHFIVVNHSSQRHSAIKH